jgi:hypothetical protein
MIILMALTGCDGGAKAKPAAGLGFPAAEFIQRLEATATNLDFKAFAKLPPPNVGEKRVTVLARPYLGVAATIESGNVTGVAFMLQHEPKGDATMRALESVTMATILVGMSEPALSPTERMKILEDCGLMRGQAGVAQHGGLRYECQVDEAEGRLKFTVSKG